MRLLRLSSAVLSFPEPLSEKCVLGVSHLGGTLYTQKGLCSTHPAAVPISKERASLQPCHLPETLVSEDLRLSFPTRARVSVHKWAKKSICSEPSFQSVTDDGKCAWGLQLGKCVFVHSASIITTSVISRAGCVSINSMTFSSLTFPSVMFWLQALNKESSENSTLCAGKVDPWILLEGLTLGLK